MIQTMDGVVMLAVYSSRPNELIDAVMVPRDLVTGELLTELSEIVGDSYELFPVTRPAVVRTKEELLAFLELLIEEEIQHQIQEDT